MLKHIEDLWNAWQIRVLVIISLALQIFLLVSAGRRKRTASFRRGKEISFTWRGPVALYFHWLLWLAYLSADSVAMFALGYLSQDQNDTHNLALFWAPFFLLHLGGQDTITALSIEDNELWKRHLLTLIYQVGLAIYVYYKSKLRNAELLPAAILMFIAGIIKYAERTWSLQRASMSSLRSSMVTKPDPGPNYAKFMEEYKSTIAAGLDAKIIVVKESQQEPSFKPFESVELPSINHNVSKKMDYPTIVFEAYQFFQIFKRLFVDLILTFEDRKKSQLFFNGRETKDAYKVIEIELSLMYEMLHSKASVTYNWYGWVFRAITLSCTAAAFYFFKVSKESNSDNESGKRIQVKLTYMLLGGAVGLEVVALICMCFSFWTYAALKQHDRWKGLADKLFAVVKIIRPQKESRWSDKMAQYNLLDYALKDTPSIRKKVMDKISVKESWDNYRYTTYVPVSDELKDLVFEELKKKMKSIVDVASYRSFSAYRGQWVLHRKGYYEELGWTVESDFDESILIWHIATDLLFHHEKSESSARYISQEISNYMLFLLNNRPFMMPAGIGQIQFGDTLAEAKLFFERGKNLKKAEAVQMILAISTEYEPREVKGDRSKSVLFDGCKLAHDLQKLFLCKDKDKDKKKNKDNVNDPDRMWKIISVVWVEMLCFAASKCRGPFHAKQLSKGGELLTVVWFLMAHLGIGEHYRIEAGHARVKLVVNK